MHPVAHPPLRKTPASRATEPGRSAEAPDRLPHRTCTTKLRMLAIKGFNTGSAVKIRPVSCPLALRPANIWVTLGQKSRTHAQGPGSGPDRGRDMRPIRPNHMGTPYGVVRDVNAVLTPPNGVVNGVPGANVPTPPYEIRPVDDDQRRRRAIDERRRQQKIGGCEHPGPSAPGCVIPPVARPPVTEDVRAVQKPRILRGLIHAKTTVDGKGEVGSTETDKKTRSCLGRRNQCERNNQKSTGVPSGFVFHKSSFKSKKRKARLLYTSRSPSSVRSINISGVNDFCISLKRTIFKKVDGPELGAYELATGAGMGTCRVGKRRH